MPRHILEGEWTGYSSIQRRVVHREVVEAKRFDRLKKLHAIVFTDGTSLILRLREKKLREKVVPINGYGSLILEAERTGRSRVLVSDLSEQGTAA